MMLSILPQRQQLAEPDVSEAKGCDGMGVSLGGLDRKPKGVKVKSYKWLGGSNVCDKCESAEVQDEFMLSSIAIALKRVNCQCADDTRIFS
eukprot:1160420-Pelagomonas_calceolata.AAC.21